MTTERPPQLSRIVLLAVPLEQLQAGIERLVHTDPTAVPAADIPWLAGFLASLAGNYQQLPLYRQNLQLRVGERVDRLMNLLIDRELVRYALLIRGEVVTAEMLVTRARREAGAKRYAEALVQCEALGYLDPSRLSGIEDLMKQVATYFYMRNEFDRVYLIYDLLNMTEPRGRYQRFINMARSRLGGETPWPFRRITSTSMPAAVYPELSFHRQKAHRLPTGETDTDDLARPDELHETPPEFILENDELFQDTVFMLKKRIELDPRNPNLHLSLSRRYRESYLKYQHTLSPSQAVAFLDWAVHYAARAASLNPSLENKQELGRVRALRDALRG